VQRRAVHAAKDVDRARVEAGRGVGLRADEQVGQAVTVHVARAGDPAAEALARGRAEQRLLHELRGGQRRERGGREQRRETERKLAMQRHGGLSRGPKAPEPTRPAESCLRAARSLA